MSKFLFPFNMTILSTRYKSMCYEQMYFMYALPVCVPINCANMNVSFFLLILMLFQRRKERGYKGKGEERRGASKGI